MTRHWLDGKLALRRSSERFSKPSFRFKAICTMPDRMTVPGSAEMARRLTGVSSVEPITAQNPLARHEVASTLRTEELLQPQPLPLLLLQTTHPPTQPERLACIAHPCAPNTLPWLTIRLRRLLISPLDHPPKLLKLDILPHHRPPCLILLIQRYPHHLALNPPPAHFPYEVIELRPAHI